MGSREAIANEKGALAEAVGKRGAVILPTEDDFATHIASRTTARVIRAGLSSGTLWASNIVMTAEGSRFTIHTETESFPAEVPAPGEHMVRNALLAVAAGMELGLDLEECAEGLAAARLTGGRLARRILRGVTVLDDTYNANPDSMEAALQTLGALPVAGAESQFWAKWVNSASTPPPAISASVATPLESPTRSSSWAPKRPPSRTPRAQLD